jgi:hypothetical protein
MGQHVYNDKTADELVDEADEAIRGLNHLTINRRGVRYPGEVYRILGGLASLVGKLPQLLQQLERPMQGWLDGDLVTIDGGEFVDDPIAAVSALSVYFIEEALPAAGGLRRAFEQGQSAIAYASYSGELDEHVQRVPVDVPPALALRVVEDTEWGIQGGDGVRVVQQSSAVRITVRRSPGSLPAAAACRCRGEAQAAGGSQSRMAANAGRVLARVR